MPSVELVSDRGDVRRGEMSPIANMLLVILLDLGVDVLMSEKKTSSVVEDVRLILTENRLTLLRGSERAARSAE